MKANPGGQIDVSCILGRDQVVRNAWAILEQQSLVISAERRIGKTSVIRKMQAEAPDGWIAVLRDLEQFHSANEFAAAVYQDVQKHLGLWKKTANRAKQALEAAGGTEVGGIVKLPGRSEPVWKSVLIGAIEDLLAEQGDRRLVFFWDEMPFMLDNIGDVAGEVLDVLRSLRQTHRNFRMVLTGSIGLHHVLRRLKSSGYANAPFNDMGKIEVTPLAPNDAIELAGKLIDGENLQPANRNASAESMAMAADHVPFYIHHIARYLKQTGQKANPPQIDAAVRDQSRDGNDPWELQHYRDRLGTYYPGQTEIVLNVLDSLALATEPKSIDQLLAAVKSQQHFDRESLLTLLRALTLDHYIQRAEQGYEFRFPLIRQWWRLSREL
ncbi:MAG: hypothetical protein ACKV2Q_13815 [Planctomycetaceae bacterium]